MKRSLALAALIATAASAHAALQPGDIAFTAFNTDEDGFAVVALRDLAPFTTIYFTDNEWSGGAPGVGSFNTGEGTYAWTSGADTIPAGTVIRFSAIDQAARAASVGAFGQVLSGVPGFAATGDTLFAYVGESPAQPTMLLTALSSDGFAGSTLEGSGLVAGINAVAVGNGADYAEYTGPRQGAASFGEYAAWLADASRWTSHANGDFAALAPDMTPFTIAAAVPEPETYALLAIGLGLIALRQRQLLAAPSTLTPGPRTASSLP